MSEINSNYKIPYQVDIKKINPDTINKQPDKKASEQRPESQEYVPDTGVIGRSQVHNIAKQQDTKSVDEAVALAKSHPEILGCCDCVFDELYEKFINDGMSPTDAYIAAAEGANEVHAAAIAAKK